MRWINVKERLPECGIRKDDDMGWLVYKPKAKSKKLTTNFYHPDWWVDYKGTSAEITHWMPLPELPDVAPEESTLFDLERARILLQAMVDMMKKQEETCYVQSIFELTAVWDDAECDGYCLYEEAKELLEMDKE